MLFWKDCLRICVKCTSRTPTFILYSLTCKQNFSTAISSYTEMKPDRVMQPLDSNTVARRMDKARSSDTDSKKRYAVFLYVRCLSVVVSHYWINFNMKPFIHRRCCTVVGFIFIFFIQSCVWTKANQTSSCMWYKRLKMLPPTGGPTRAEHIV